MPATLLIPGGMQGVLLCSSGMVYTGAHNTVDVQRHVGEPYRMGVNGAHNTVGKMSAPTTLCVREVAEYCFCRRIGYGPWYYCLTCASCLAFSIRSLVLSERASPVGWSQSALVAPVEEEQ